MKKILFALFLLEGIAFASCQKCEVCTVIDDDGKEFYDYPEACGKKERDARQKECEADYEHAQYSCVCQKQ